MAAVAPVVQTVIDQGGADLYFQYAERVFEKHLAEGKQSTASAQQHRHQDQRIEEEMKQSDKSAAARERERQILLACWKAMSREDIQACYERALSRYTSNTAQEKIRNSTLENPCAELLEELKRIRNEAPQESDSLPAPS